MNLKQLISQARLTLTDEVEPYLWSDEALTSYFNEAVQEACERALLIEDMHTPAVCNLAVTVGKALYALHPSVLKVSRASLDGKVLDETSIEKLDTMAGKWMQRSGQPRSFIFVQAVGGAGHPGIQLVPAPTHDGQLALRVYRGALSTMRCNSGDSPEIPVRHHHKLVNWVARCAYLRPDPDGQDPRKAAQHEAIFVTDFGERPDANVQRKQRDKRPRLVKSNW